MQINGSCKTANIISDKEIIVNHNALETFIRPAGIALFSVRGFNLSIFLSIMRFNAIAAVRPPTIAIITHTNIIGSGHLFVTDNSIPLKANGKAKILCSNFTKSLYSFILAVIDTCYSHWL